MNFIQDGNNFVNKSKDSFNDFFQDYLYGYFDNESNIILSRGTWEDNFIKYPDLFKFAINFTLEKQWSGYSDSLGHSNVFDKLVGLINVDGTKYDKNNCALTLGNVTGLSFVFLHISKILKKENIEKGELLTISPFYPSILNSSSNYFNLNLIDSYGLSEELLFEELKEVISSRNIDVLMLPNLIGVDGRSFSEDFFRKIITLTNNKGIYLIIDELTWFNRLEYPDNINSDNVIRMVSLSKMFGIPGMKLGYMLGSEDFISGYYNTASSGYGGPASSFFLLQEFLFCFEKNRLIENKELSKEDLDSFVMKYKISEDELSRLYLNYINTIDINYRNFLENYDIVKNWAEQNKDFFNGYSLNEENPPINTIFELKGLDDFSFFTSLVKLYKTSVFPGKCIGFNRNNIIRLNFLEEQSKLKDGLNSISKLLHIYKKKVTDNIKFLILDEEYIEYINDFNDFIRILGFKNIYLGVLKLGFSTKVEDLIISTKVCSHNILLNGVGDYNYKDLIRLIFTKLGIGYENILYLGNNIVIRDNIINSFDLSENSETNLNGIDKITNFILMET